MDENLIMTLKEKAESLYQQEDFLCSEAVLWVINDYLGRPLPQECVRLASGFPVGIGGGGLHLRRIDWCHYVFRVKIRAHWS